MTRSEKLNKLANAIRDYRGSYIQDSGVWVRRPKSAALGRVESWLSRLGADVTEGMVAVNGFKTLDEFRAWIKTV